MSSFIIKIIAIISMICDHTGDILIGHNSILNVIGRIAFPLFAFQLVIGYAHTRNKAKYFVRLLLFAIISQIPYSIMSNIISGSYFYLNIFFTLATGVLAMTIYDLDLNAYSYKYIPIQLKEKFISFRNNHSNNYKIYSASLKVLFICLLLSISEILNFDYEAWGVLLILIIHIFYKNKFYNISNDKKIYDIIFIVVYSLICVARFIPYWNLLPSQRLFPEIIFTILPIAFMYMYNGKKGPSLKYFFYIFYPLHLIILEMLYYFFIIH